MRHFVKSHRSWLLYLSLVFAALWAGWSVSVVNGQEAGAVILSDEDQACMACHSEEMEGSVPVHLKALHASPHKEMTCQSCHTEITAAPHTPEMIQAQVDCATCHYEVKDTLATSVHAKADKEPGDHPTCASCHASADPHGIKAVAQWTRAEKTTSCSECHSQAERMARYGVDPDAVHSYNESFHGKALLRFGMDSAAGCTDCHKAHDVLSPSNPEAPTHRNNAAVTCSTSGCHPGAQMNFAMSGANHLRLKIKQSPILHAEELFFRWLTIGTIIFLLGGVALDLRRKVFHPGAEPRSGRAVGILISASFLLLVAALALAFFGASGAGLTATAAILLMVGAFVAYLVLPRPTRKVGSEKYYQRLSLAQRWQHVLLAVSFTLLVLTGLPLRFAQVDWVHSIYVLFGGLDGSRIVHRVAAVVMIVAWIWHTLYLLYKWKQAGFTWNSWTMWPNRKDVADFVAVSRHYLGLSHEEPQYDRFQFREKFDYFAVYWGMPIMVFSGLVLWFPIYFGNRLPEIGLSVAYIAHSDEAILAFLAIVTWHLYNVHFNPDAFPMSPAWYTGTKSREEMEREHPLELARIEKAEQKDTPS